MWVFYQRPITNRGRQQQADILVGKPGPIATDKKITTAIDAFYNFFTSEIVDITVERTNAKIAKILDNAPEELLSRDSFMKETTAIEICAFIGFLIYKRGCTKWTRLELSDSSQKDMEHQSSVLLCLRIDFFSFLQTFLLTTKESVLTDADKTASLLWGNGLNCLMNNAWNA